LSRTFIITDTHFDDALRGELGKVCGRPDDNSQQTYEHLSNLLKGDLLIHLGDITLGDSRDVHEKYIRPLSCKKVLVRGNHDGKSNSWYLEHGWDFVCDSFINRYLGMRVLFSHIPSKIPADIHLNIHGHFHNIPVPMIRQYDREALERTTMRHLCLSLEDMGYKPWLLDDVLKSYYQGKNIKGTRIVAEEVEELNE